MDTQYALAYIAALEDTGPVINPILDKIYTSGMEFLSFSAE